MPTFVFPKEPMVAGASRVSGEIVVPSGLTEARATLDMNTAEMRDPSTNVKGLLEFFDETEGTWRLIAATQLEGHPDNNVQNQPFIFIGSTTLDQLTGKRIRGRIEALSDGNYGATLNWS